MTTETETVDDVLVEMGDYFDDEREMFDTYSSRIQAAHAREVGRYSNAPRVTQSDNTMPLCVHCGQPTMHIGNVCYRCSHLPLHGGTHQ